MVNPGDVQLDRTTEAQGFRREGHGARIAAMVLAAIAMLGVAYVLLGRWRAPSAPAAQVETKRPGAPSTHVETPKAVAGLGIALGPLDETDGIVRELVGKLSSHPTIAAWLATDQLVRHFTVALVRIAGGASPGRVLSPIAPRQRFPVGNRGGSLYITPEGYRRYDRYADAFTGLDARGTAQLYATLKPALQQAYDELGHPEGSIDTVMETAIVLLLKTPVIDGNVALEQNAVMYRFADPRLESLPAAQRQLLRMGPRNVRLVQAKIREIAPLLGIALGRLPTPHEEPH